MPLTAVAIATNFSSSTCSSGAERAEQRRGLLALPLLTRPAWRTRRSSRGRAGPGVFGIARTMASWPSALRSAVVVGAGEDADDELVRPQRCRQLASHALEHLRLDRQDDDVGGLDGFGVRFGRADAELTLELGAPLRARVAREDLLDAQAFARQADPRSSIPPSRPCRRSRRSSRSVARPRV